MALVRWEKDGAVAILHMENGANRQNLDYANEMCTAMDGILEEKDIQALVLTSSDTKNFSQGVDLEWLMTCQQQGDVETIKKFMYRMNDVYRKLLLYPIPVIAAINGHAFAGGAILTCACDFRFMRLDKGFFCFPEVDLGIPFLPGMIAWVKKAIPYYQFQEMKYTGARYTAEQLEQHHIIHKACKDVEELMIEAKAFAKTFQKKRGIFGEMKRRMHSHIIDIMDNEDPKYIEPMNIIVFD